TETATRAWSRSPTAWDTSPSAGRWTRSGGWGWRTRVSRARFAASSRTYDPARSSSCTSDRPETSTTRRPTRTRAPASSTPCAGMATSSRRFQQAGEARVVPERVEIGVGGRHLLEALVAAHVLEGLERRVRVPLERFHAGDVVVDAGIGSAFERFAQERCRT